MVPHGVNLPVRLIVCLGGAQVELCFIESASTVRAVDEGEVNRLVSGCLLVGCSQKQITKSFGNRGNKNSAAKQVNNFKEDTTYVRYRGIYW